MILMIMAPFVLATMVIVFLFTAGARHEIEEKAPSYASLLYCSVKTQLFNRRYPIRGLVLFFEPAPPEIIETIKTMRTFYAIHFALVWGFLIKISMDLI